jgi:hypothetical protein
MQVLAKEKKMIAGIYKRKAYNSPYERDGARDGRKPPHVGSYNSNLYSAW